jgi:outer membrane murein-binding lipoprotein Lpp
MSPLPPADDAATVAPPQIDLDHAETIVPDSSGADSHYAPGVTFPGYQLLKELGRGGMGVVYLARQHGLNREVALKMVLAGGHATATEKARFLAEAEAVATVRHPGVVQVFDFGTHDGHPFFALEYLPGGSLAAKLNGTPLPPKEAAALVVKIARAVQAAHDAGTIHRDLKPGNILFDADGSPKVTDFGLARKSESSSGLTQTGAILGTPSYMAPEQAEGRKDVGPPADVYAVGAILYECLTGRPPFRAATPLETIHQLLKEEPVPPSRFTPKLPRDLETVCLKCLSKDPRKRYPSAGAVADDLNRFLAGEPIVARPVSVVEKYWRSVRRRPLVHSLVLLTCISIGVAIGTLTGSVKNLRRKQEQLEKEKAAADTARQTANARLEKAIEAVDKMMTRVNGERWVTNPALQDERRQVLEDAAAFFTGFTGEDSADPRVRREAAKAHARVAGAYLALSELPKVVVAGREANRLYDGLMAEFPDDPELSAEASHVCSLLGNEAALSARYADALGDYTRSVELADAARARSPDSAEYKLRAVEARASLSYFYIQADRAKGEAVVGVMLPLAREVGGDPAAPFANRTALAFALTTAAAYDMLAGKLPAAKAKYDEAVLIAEGLVGKPAPSARVWSQFTFTRAMATFQAGFATVITTADPERKRAGAAQMRKGLELYDGLLAVDPKAFPYRLQKYQGLRALAQVSRGLGDQAGAQAADEAADRLIEEMIADNSHLEWLRGMDARRLANRLVARVRAEAAHSFEAEADDLLALGRRTNQPDVTYDIACVYSVASGNRPESAEKHAARAMSLLNGLIDIGYFKVPQRAAHLDKDTDLDPLRTRDDYKAFRQAVDESNAAAKPK